MKLNIDCMRDVLLYLENKTCMKDRYFLDNNIQMEDLYKDIPKYTEDELDYTVVVLAEKELIICFAYNCKYKSLERLAEKGMDLVSLIRDEDIWSIVRNKSNDIDCNSIEIIYELCKSEIRKKLEIKE